VRAAYGLPAVTTFAQITSNVTVQQELAKAYPGGVDTIDPFEGGLAEDHAPGSDMGPLFTTILADQFTRLRDGDRFFYLNQSFNQEELNVIHQGDTLAKVIENNTNITNLQSDVFFFQATIKGTVLNPVSGTGISGITVDLLDSSGNVLATTVTDRGGHYSFNDFSGLGGTGTYTVQVILPSGAKSTKPTSVAVPISRGDVNARVDFSIELPRRQNQAITTTIDAGPGA
jgi:hypothetical protein